MTEYIKAFNDPKHPYHKEAVRLVERFETDDVVIKGDVPFWTSNDAVPPQEILELWAHVGKPISVEKAMEIRDRQVDEAITRYKEAQANMTPEQAAEHNAELRAAFFREHGGGTTVVNVITGKKTYL